MNGRDAIKPLTKELTFPQESRNMKVLKNKKGGGVMTQLVGVICEDRSKVILISDRMVTTADGSLAFEHEAKCSIVASNALVLRAGTMHEPELIEDTKNEIKEGTMIREIAESLSKSYRQMRRKRIEHEVLGGMGISSFEEFHDKHNILHENTILELSEGIKKYHLGVHLLLGGVDEGAHLYMVTDPGTYRSFDELGFCCIGSGDRHAEPVFAFYGFSLELSAVEALRIAFEAKKRAEMAGGVGRETDAWIIEKGGIYEITQETIRELEDSRINPEDISQILKEVEIKTEKPKLTAT